MHYADGQLEHQKANGLLAQITTLSEPGTLPEQGRLRGTGTDRLQSANAWHAIATTDVTHKSAKDQLADYQPGGRRGDRACNAMSPP